MKYYEIDETKEDNSIIGLTLSIRNYFDQNNFYDYKITKIEDDEVYISGHGTHNLKYFCKHNYLTLQKLAPYKGDNNKIIEYLQNKVNILKIVIQYD